MPGFDTWQKEQSDDVPDWLPVDLLNFNVVRLSQSFVNGWRKCPSSAVADKERPTYGVAAAKGIVAHAIVDARIAAQNKNDAIDNQAARAKLKELAEGGWEPPADPSFERDYRDFAEEFTKIYLAEYHRYAPFVRTEVHDQVIWDVRDEPGDVDFIIFTGSADLLLDEVSEEGELIRRICVDWKSGQQMEEPWMIQRYGVQWRAYAVIFQLDEMHVRYPIALQKGNWIAERYKGIARVYASPEERAAYERQLIHECIPVAEAVLRTTDYSRHEIRPTNWHCGAAWCQVFARDECMGQDHSVAWISKSHEKAAKDAAAISTNRKKQQ